MVWRSTKDSIDSIKRAASARSSTTIAPTATLNEPAGARLPVPEAPEPVSISMLVLMPVPVSTLVLVLVLVPAFAPSRAASTAAIR